MTEPFRFRYVNQITGIFVLAAIGVVSALLIMRAQRWLEPMSPLTVSLPKDKGSLGLRNGSTVELLGVVIGSVVEDIEPTKSGIIQAKIKIRASFLELLPADSTAVVKKRTLGLAGDAFIELRRGADKSTTLRENAEIASTVDSGPTDLFEQLVRDVGEEIVPAVEDLRKAIKEHTLLTESLRSPDGELQRLLARANAIGQNIQDGNGILARLLQDDRWVKKIEGSLDATDASIKAIGTGASDIAKAVREFRGDLQPMVKELSGTMKSLPPMLREVRDGIAELRKLVAGVGSAATVLPELTAKLRAEARNMPGVLLQTRRTLSEIEELIVAMQRHWLISSYFEPLPATGRIPPGDAGGTGK